MKQYYPGIGLGKLCRLFGKTRQAYYEQQWEYEQESIEFAVILELVADLRSAMDKVGTRKLHSMLEPHLKLHGIRIGRDKLFALLADHGLLVRRRRRARTTNSRHWLKKYPNLIGYLVVDRPEQVWVSDITYIALRHGFSYLSLITDAYSRRIMGYDLSKGLKAEGCIQALLMALRHRTRSEQLIHHSDRGIQYCCSEYVQILKSRTILISMTEKGDPYENAIAERVNGILKSEFGLGEVFQNYEQAQEAVKKAVSTYNSLRPHASCDYLTPDQAHQKEGELRKRWKNYKRSSNDENKPVQEEECNEIPGLPIRV